MYICLCKAITEKMLNDSIKSQGGNISQGIKALGLGSECGTCLAQSLEDTQYRQEKKHKNSMSSKPVKSK